MYFLSKKYALWIFLIINVGLSIYFVVVSVYRDVMPNRHGTWMSNELLTVLLNKDKLDEEDKKDIESILKTRGFGIEYLGIFKDFEHKGRLQKFKTQDAIFVNSEIDELDVLKSLVGTYGSWTIVRQWKVEYQEKSLLNGYTRGLQFLTLAMILYGIMAVLKLKEKEFGFKGVILYIPPQLVALCVFVFTFIRINN